MDTSVCAFSGALLGSAISLFNPHPINFIIGLIVGAALGILFCPKGNKCSKRGDKKQ